MEQRDQREQRGAFVEKRLPAAGNLHLLSDLYRG